MRLFLKSLLLLPLLVLLATFALAQSFQAAPILDTAHDPTDLVSADFRGNGKLDFAYIDADHTLKGIAIDLIRVYPKVRAGGFLGGDDFTRSVWEHNTRFEPTLVFPFAVYFAEAVDATIYALPYSQFCLQKTSASQFAFVDLTGLYDDVGLQNQFAPEKLLKLAAGERFPRLLRVARKIRGLLPG